MLPHLIGRRGPGRAIVVGDTGGSSGVGDGGFVEPPVVTTTASGNTTIKGKVKPGSFGKFVVPLATVTAGRQYTFRYTPQFSQLAQQGKLAMVGFGFKNNNDFHIAGLRGDGSTGIHKYKVYGTPPNGWNQQTGHTVSDGGASANGTQAGPNYLRVAISADGTTYTLKSSPDGVTWTDEFTGAAPTPFTNVSGVATFGIALWFNNADAGPFSIVVDQFADVAAPLDPVTFIGRSAGAVSGGALTYASAPLNPAAADRLVVVVLTGESVGNYSTTGVSVGGTALTLWSQGRIQLFTSVVTYLEIYYGIVSSGAAPNIVATMTATNACMDVYCCSGLSATPVDQVPKTSASGTSCAINDIETKVGGALIAAIATQNAATSLTEGWTGAGSVVEDTDADISGGGNVRAGAAHILTTAATTTDDFTFTLSASKTFVGGAISFGP